MILATLVTFKEKLQLIMILTCVGIFDGDENHNEEILEESIMTTLNTNQKEFAKALYNADLTGNPLVEADWKGVVEDDETAYAVQDEVMKLKGVPVGGYKVSLTSRQTQDMFAADSPLYGQQVNRKFLPAPSTVKLGNLMDPLVEVELAFRATADLTSEDSLEDLLRKTTVAGALEVPDSRFKEWFPSLGKYNVMADCAVGGLVVYGNEVPSTNVFSAVTDVATVNAELFFNDVKLDEGNSKEVLGNPLKSLQWLVGKLEEQGKQFKQGQLVSSGTFVLPPHLKKGHWQVKFDHHLGNVDLTVN